MLGWPWFKICTGVAVFAISSGRDWEIYTHTEVSGVENIGQCGRLSQLRWLWAHLNIVTYLLTYLHVIIWHLLDISLNCCVGKQPTETVRLRGLTNWVFRTYILLATVTFNAQSDFMVWHRRRRRCCPHETSRECITKAMFRGRQCCCQTQVESVDQSVTVSPGCDVAGHSCLHFRVQARERVSDVLTSDVNPCPCPDPCRLGPCLCPCPCRSSPWQVLFLNLAFHTCTDCDLLI